MEESNKAGGAVGRGGSNAGGADGGEGAKDLQPQAPATTVRRTRGQNEEQIAQTGGQAQADDLSPLEEVAAKASDAAGKLAKTPAKRGARTQPSKSGRPRQTALKFDGADAAETASGVSHDSEAANVNIEAMVPKPPTPFSARGRRRKGRVAAINTPPKETSAAAAAAASPAAISACKTPQKKPPPESGFAAAAAATISPPKKAWVSTPPPPPAMRRRPAGFGSPGGQGAEVTCLPQVERVYSIIQKKSGSVGGNACGGAIYGELTMKSMQKVVNCMKDLCGLDAASAFLDVGSGLGKPNFHVAQDPGCQISYGVELEEVRWRLSIHNLRAVLYADAGTGSGGAGGGGDSGRRSSRGGPASAAAAGNAAHAGSEGVPSPSADSAAAAPKDVAMAAAAFSAALPAAIPAGAAAAESDSLVSSSVALSQEVSAPPRGKTAPPKISHKKKRQTPAAAAAAAVATKEVKEKKEKAPLRQHNVIFARADITDASTFDPFTHVYTFDVGFPPATLGRMAAMFNASGARYLINYHPPKQTVDRDGFDVELVAQMHTSLTGSGESHQVYFYRRRGVPPAPKAAVAEAAADQPAAAAPTAGQPAPAPRIAWVDPLFRTGVELCQHAAEDGGSALVAAVENSFQGSVEGIARTRSRSRARVAPAGAVSGPS